MLAIILFAPLILGVSAQPAAPTEPDMACEAAGPGCNIDPSDKERYCQGTKQDASFPDRYVCGDPRLGPVRLPTTAPMVDFAGAKVWNRLGGYCPGDFLAKCWNETGNGWKWPPRWGFEQDWEDRVQDIAWFEPGDRLDRFGSQWGNFFANASDLLPKRAIPPMNLNTPTNDGKPDGKRDCYHPWNYHLYEVRLGLLRAPSPSSWLTSGFGRSRNRLQPKRARSLPGKLCLSHTLRLAMHSDSQGLVLGSANRAVGNSTRPTSGPRTWWPTGSWPCSRSRRTTKRSASASTKSTTMDPSRGGSDARGTPARGGCPRNPTRTRRTRERVQVRRLG